MKNILIVTLSLLSVHMVSFGVSVRELLGGGVGKLDAGWHASSSTRGSTNKDYLDLSSEGITNLDGLSDIEGIGNFTTINLVNNQIANERKDLLGMDSVKEIFLDANQISDDGISPDAFSALRPSGAKTGQVKNVAISLTDNPISEEQIKRLLGLYSGNSSVILSIGVSEWESGL